MAEGTATSPDSAGGDNEMLELIATVGEALNRSMYPVSQTKQVIAEINEAYGNEISAEVFATYTIALDRRRGDVTVTNTGSMYRFDQAAQTESLIHELRSAAMPVRQALRELRAIADTPAPFNPVVRVIGFMLQALGFSLCFQMSLPATILAVVISAPVSMVLLWSSVRGTFAALMPFLLTFLSSLAIALWAVHIGVDDPVRLAVIPVLTLIPGAGLTTALIELTAGDMIAGASRLVSTLIVLLSMAFGLALAVDIVGLSPSDLQDVTSAHAPSWVLWLAAPVFAVGNIMFACTPRRAWIWTVLLACGTFGLSHLLQKSISSAFACGIAMGVALLVAFVVNAHVKGRPSVLVMYMPTWWLMVPGSMGFVALSGAITANRELADLGTSAVLALMSMAVCIMIASVLTPFVSRPLPSRRQGQDGPGKPGEPLANTGYDVD
ncbi:threonine/serine exporter family protein [Gordonia desulfuricans]|uniref:Threonine/serine exporter family protein n=1 Tax=Gordonia desulfuricans TaxID=89051 RepID=A0A7K3LTP5_9ACTN|nr:threonine/serine exporter family protein [Gordonia desulfuricans]NDK91623.1 threonine/serine exporter family protein [Gordonia desulfuricans]